MIRGGWARFEATHSYLQTGLYASISIHLLPEVKERAKSLEKTWPRGLYLPARFSAVWPEEVYARFRANGGPGWGLEGMHRGLDEAAAPPPPRAPARWER